MILLAAALLVAAPMSEDRAIALTAAAMVQLTTTPRANCLAYDVEDRSRRHFDIAVREVHDRRCGGDPDVMPVIERFRIGRAPLSLARYDVTQDRWRHCTVANRRRPRCP